MRKIESGSSSHEEHEEEKELDLILNEHFNRQDVNFSNEVQWYSGDHLKTKDDLSHFLMWLSNPQKNIQLSKAPKKENACNQKFSLRELLLKKQDFDNPRYFLATLQAIARVCEYVYLEGAPKLIDADICKLWLESWADLVHNTLTAQGKDPGSGYSMYGDFDWYLDKLAMKMNKKSTDIAKYSDPFFKELLESEEEAIVRAKAYSPLIEVGDDPDQKGVKFAIPVLLDYFVTKRITASHLALIDRLKQVDPKNFEGSNKSHMSGEGNLFRPNK